MLQGIVQRLLTNAVQGLLHGWLQTELTLHQQARLDASPALHGVNPLLQSAHQPFLLQRQWSQLVNQQAHLFEGLLRDLTNRFQIPLHLVEILCDGGSPGRFGQKGATVEGLGHRVV